MAINLTGPGEVLTVISDGPGVVDEELTLALVQGDEQVDVKVRVVATLPQVLNGVLRHHLTLEVLGEQRTSAETRLWTR